VRINRKRFDVTEAAKAAILTKFTAAVEARDENTLFELFARDATWTADGGGRAPAAMRTIEGVERVVRLILGLQPRIQGRIELASINGETGLALRLNGELTSVISIDTDGDRITAVYVVTNPDKLPPSHTA
jgi:RNA polymerase sigma-70 factor (ECF subfamily)